MRPDWQKEYINLKEFIAQHPEIKIETSVVRIPSEYSSLFYTLHKKARTVFLEEKIPRLLEKSKTLSKNYMKIEEEVTNLLGLQDINMAHSLYNFLQDPVDQLIQEIYNTFFGLLKGQLDVEGYEEDAIRKIDYFYRKYYRSGYEKWLILSLVKLLKADKVFKVIPEEVTEDDSFRHGGAIDYKIPDPVESPFVSFKREEEVGFMVPDLLMHSTATDEYYSFTSEMIKTWATATNPSNKREWLAGDPNVIFESGIILVYKDEILNNLSLVTDMKRTCRADLIIECREQEDWHEREGLEKIKFHYEKYKPKLGTYIVTLEKAPKQIKLDLATEISADIVANEQEEGLTVEEESEDQKPVINMITVGYNQNHLKPIVEIITKRRT